MIKAPKCGGLVSTEEKPGFLLETDDIENYLHQRVGNSFLGAIPQDHMGEMEKKRKEMNLKTASVVINLDKSTSMKGGTHWVAAFYSNGKWEYFDPFGQPPSKYLKRVMGIRDKFNKNIYQHPNNHTCGVWTIKWLLKKNNIKL